ncbi:hypothetical protein PISMIDRAFT_347068 [Pisolithus microcarpus 441]|uniref:Unplaced genomic scaffold scaffold_246, whole genome shotgun sequence n=1 Tax=Pisolithus microcarpus 441 TaxID=765257 RepID=A0A0C9YD53_9AGAM|nr:hypothetical protein PISMIDRAFT_347068 [Pisolithus microcarpus 441]
MISVMFVNAEFSLSASYHTYSLGVPACKVSFNVVSLQGREMGVEHRNSGRRSTAVNGTCTPRGNREATERPGISILLSAQRLQLYYAGSLLAQESLMFRRLCSASHLSQNFGICSPSHGTGRSALGFTGYCCTVSHLHP